MMKRLSFENPTALILAGGMGRRLNVLAKMRAKPAVPFGGIYRIIDFALSNASNSGLDHAGVLTQYRPASLMDHLGSGESWDFMARTRCLKILPPYQRISGSDWYRGTADAVYQNLSFIRHHPSDEVLVLSGDHIYYMDFRLMHRFHLEKGADLTIAVMPVEPQDVPRFGIMGCGNDGRVTGFWEKPKVQPGPQARFANMGIYIFNRRFLVEELSSLIEGGRGFDFGKDMIPPLITKGRIYAYEFKGYWRDVGTIQSYWDANMDILRPGSGLNLREWNLRTNLRERRLQDRAPTVYGPEANVKNSIVSRGCKIMGEVSDSIISPGVVVREGAVVKRSILFHDVVAGRGARIDMSILDKDVVVGDGARIGIGDGEVPSPNVLFPDHLSTGISVIGKGARIPDRVGIGANCLVFPGTGEGEFPSRTLESGKCAGKER